jgi:hypothetical protein
MVHGGVLAFLTVLILVQFHAVGGAIMRPDGHRVTTLEMVYLVCLMVIAVVHGTTVFRWPVRASLDSRSGALVLGRPFRSSLVLKPDDLRGFSQVDDRDVPFDIVNEHGLILYLKNARPVQLRSLNLQAIAPLRDLLQEWGVPFIGNESWPPPWSPFRYAFDRE